MYHNQKDQSMNQDNFVQWERVATTSEPGEAVSILKEQLTKIKLLSNEVAIRTQQLEILKEQVSELEAQREGQEVQAARSEKRWNAKEEELNQKIYSLQEKNEGLGIFSQQLIERVKGLNQQASGFEREIAQLRLQLDKANAERCCFIQELEAAKQLANELEERAVQSRTEVLAARGDNSLLIQDSERLQNEVETLKSGIACLNGEIEKKQNKIEQQEKKNIKKDEKIQQLEEKLSLLEDEYRRSERKLGESAKLGAENSQLRVEVSNLKSRFEENCRIIENLKATIAKQEEMTEKCKSEIKQNKKIIQEIKKKNESLVSESLNAQGQILELRESMERAENARDRELRLIAEQLEEKLRDEDRRGLGKIKAGYRSKEMIRTFQNSIISSQISRGDEETKDQRSSIEIVREKVKQLNDFCEKQRVRAENMEEQHAVLNERIEKLQNHADELCQLTQIKAEEQDQQIVEIHMKHQEELHQLKQLYDMKLESMTNKIDIDNSKLNAVQMEIKQQKNEIMQLQEAKLQLTNENTEISKKALLLGNTLARSLEGFRYIWSEYAESRNSLAFLRRFIGYHSTVSAVIHPKNKLSVKQRLRKCIRAVIFVQRVNRLCDQDLKNRNIQKENDSKDNFLNSLSWAHKSIQKAFISQNISQDTQSIQEILNQLLSSKQALHQASSASLISQILRKCISYPTITAGRIGEAIFKAKSSKDAQKIISLIKENEEFQSELAQMTKRVQGLSEQTKNIETQIGQSLESKYIQQLTEKDNIIAQIMKNPQELSAQKSFARRSLTEQMTEQSEETRANNWSNDIQERQLTHPVVSRTHSLISHAPSGIKKNNQSLDLLRQELSQIEQLKNVPDSQSTHSFYSQNIGSSIAYSSSSSSVSQSTFLKCPGKIVRNASKV